MSPVLVMIHVGVNMLPLDGTSVAFSLGNYRQDVVRRLMQHLLSSVKPDGTVRKR